MANQYTVKVLERCGKCYNAKWRYRMCPRARQVQKPKCLRCGNRRMIGKSLSEKKLYDNCLTKLGFITEKIILVD